MTAVATEAPPKPQNFSPQMGWYVAQISPKRHRVSEFSDVKKIHVGGRSSPTFVGELTDSACACWSAGYLGWRSAWCAVLVFAV